MADLRDNLTRRDFLRGTCAAGAAAMAGGAGGAGSPAQAADAAAPAAGGAAGLTPTRVLGKTGLKIPILGLGGEFDTVRNQIILKQAHALGVRFWDTAQEYVDSEKGYGEFLAKNPACRKEIILSTKTLKRDPEGMSKELDGSLAALKTDSVDLYFLHRLQNPNELGDWQDLWKPWAEKAKKAGKIKFFGVSFHDNVMENMLAVAKAGWIDVAMFLCNFRVLGLSKFRKGMDAVKAARLGTIAIKVQALGLANRPLTEKETADMAGLTGKGYSEYQARLKLLWEEADVHSACCLMKNLAQLGENAAAAVDKVKLSAGQKAAWGRYAEATCEGYCAGCERICSAAVGGQVPVRDILRMLTYHNAYGDRERARRLFAALGADVRGHLMSVDYAAAERCCPQGVAIAARMQEAASVLA